MTTVIECTRLIKADGPLTKKLHLAADGKLANDSSQCRMSRGRAERAPLVDLRAFATLIEATPSNVALALGRLRDGLPDAVQVVVKRDLKAGKPGFIARTQDNFVYRKGKPALALHDYDTKGMPPDVKARVAALGGFTGALAAVCPGFAEAGYVRRRSTSANVVNIDTGEEYQTDGEHVFLTVADGSDARRYLYALHDRAWLNGFGWTMVGKAGQLLERSIVDKMVCAAERLVFEAAPDLEGPLKQLERKATVHDGPPLDTVAACPDLTARETADLKQLKAAAAEDRQGEAATAKAAFVEERTAKLVARGVDPARAKETAKAWSRGVLRPDATLEFDDPEIGTRTVADVLADPEAYIDEALADPIEGVEYGQQTAKILRRPTGEVFVNSFAHGGALYRLVYDARSVEEAILAAPKEEATRTLFRLIARADVDAVDRKRLCRLAGARSGLGTRVAEKMVKEAIAEHEEAEAEEQRKRNERESTKARLSVPPPDAEAAPVMRQWDDILANVSGPTPPMRDVEGWPVAVEERTVAGLHELTANAANDEVEEDADAKTRLPAPKIQLLTKHSLQSLEIELSDHMTFVAKTKHGDRAVAPHSRFLTHWLKYKRSRLPTLRAVITATLVLP